MVSPFKTSQRLYATKTSEVKQKSSVSLLLPKKKVEYPPRAFTSHSLTESECSLHKVLPAAEVQSAAASASIRVTAIGELRGRRIREARGVRVPGDPNRKWSSSLFSSALFSDGGVFPFLCSSGWSKKKWQRHNRLCVNKIKHTHECMRVKKQADHFCNFVS